MVAHLPHKQKAVGSSPTLRKCARLHLHVVRMDMIREQTNLTNLTNGSGRGAFNTVVAVDRKADRLSNSGNHWMAVVPSYYRFFIYRENVNHILLMVEIISRDVLPVNTLFRRELTAILYGGDTV